MSLDEAPFRKTPHWHTCANGGGGGGGCGVGGGGDGRGGEGGGPGDGGGDGGKNWALKPALLSEALNAAELAVSAGSISAMRVAVVTRVTVGALPGQAAVTALIREPAPGARAAMSDGIMVLTKAAAWPTGMFRRMGLQPCSWRRSESSSWRRDVGGGDGGGAGRTLAREAEGFASTAAGIAIAATMI